MLVEEQNNAFLSDHFLHCSYYSGQLACEVGGGGGYFLTGVGVSIHV